jgi:hypothetical protein
VVITVLGTEVSLPAAFRLFPNPARRMVTLTVPPHLVVRAVRLHDARGKLIREWPGSPAAALDVSALPKGWYVVQVQTREGNVHKKLLVQ